MDVLSSIPFNLLVPYGPNSRFNWQPIQNLKNHPRTLRYIRATKMIRYLRVFKEIEGFVDIITFRKIESVVLKKMCETVIVTLTYFIISASLWYVIGAHNMSVRTNWLFRLSYTDRSPLSTMLASLYWSIQTIFTVGYGDMPAVTKLEMTFSIFTQIFGSIILAYIYASMTIFIKYVNMEKDTKRYTVDYLKRVRRKYGLKPRFFKVMINKVKRSEDE